MTSLQDIAQQYVALVLALGAHDADYVDAYYGPPAWRTEAEAAPRPLPEIDDLAAHLQQRLASLGRQGVPGNDVREAELLGLRRVYLHKHLAALRTRVALLRGTQLPFDEESQALYDAVAPERGEADFREALDALNRALAGSGTLLERYTAFRNRFVIPAGAVPAVFEAAIRACRERTIAAMPLPAGEQFTLEFVQGKSWSGYNWYQGGLRSLIQVNTDLPIHVDRAVELAAHEGYPGHHVHNVCIEEQLVRRRGWVEFTAYPLHSPQSFIAEGIANCAPGMVFSPSERLTFERDVLFPLAGLDPALAARYAVAMQAAEKLTHAGTEAARRLLDGRLDDEGAIRWLESFALYSRPRAEQRVRFIRQYRSYVINYTRGRELVDAWLTRKAGDDRPRRWTWLGDLMASPRLASSLQ
ncbi:MAG: hypothetical protein AB7I25_13215 [Vicinamibacterales bacterium]